MHRSEEQLIPRRALTGRESSGIGVRPIGYWLDSGGDDWGHPQPCMMAAGAVIRVSFERRTLLGGQQPPIGGLSTIT
jgi:hypothetical protein